MANLPRETLVTIANLLPRLFEVINLAKFTEFQLFETYGETDETISELDEVSNAAERLRSLYNGLYNLVLQVAESQPMATNATMSSLVELIAKAEPTASAVEASALETKRNWNLP